MDKTIHFKVTEQMYYDLVAVRAKLGLDTWAQLMNHTIQTNNPNGLKQLNQPMGIAYMQPNNTTGLNGANNPKVPNQPMGIDSNTITNELPKINLNVESSNITKDYPKDAKEMGELFTCLICGHSAHTQACVCGCKEKGYKAIARTSTIPDGWNPSCRVRFEDKRDFCFCGHPRGGHVDGKCIVEKCGCDEFDLDVEATENANKIHEEMEKGGGNRERVDIKVFVCQCGHPESAHSDVGCSDEDCNCMKFELDAEKTLKLQQKKAKPNGMARVKGK